MVETMKRGNDDNELWYGYHYLCQQRNQKSGLRCMCFVSVIFSFLLEIFQNTTKNCKSRNSIKGS